MCGERRARVIYICPPPRPLVCTPQPVHAQRLSGCRASCVDWYGNSRPLFVRGRVFALLGYEIVEGKIDEQRIVETRRVNFAPTAVAVTR